MTWNRDANLATDYKEIIAQIKTAGDCIDQHRKKVFVFNVTIIILVILIVIVVALVFALSKDSLLTILGSLASLFALVITLVLMMQLFLQADNTKKQIAAEQFKNAIQHLGDEKQAIVLGGVHALHNLAKTFPNEYSKQVFEVLCSFIREETAKDDYKKKLKNVEEATAFEDKTQVFILTIVIQTIVDKLFCDEKSRVIYQEYKANLSGAILRKISLSRANLQRARLWGVDFRGASLGNANLQGADLMRADLRETYLREANLQGAQLYKAQLQLRKTMDEYLGCANFRGVQSKNEDLCYLIANAKQGNPLETDLSNIDLYCFETKEIVQCSKEDKMKWFRDCCIFVLPSLPAKEVLEIFKDIL